ncbi:MULTISPECIES: hypothetical protein [unclassified Pseudomonas]|uniref:hypothetical protein n=1 Tax=unclassified Pseudomonas TaxID=196821 RepID=UPI00087702F8|nr:MULTISPECIES: hypothetical protein [unclassified Pseudomonas]SCZ40025.1 hypothetical protein SAMN03159405_04293 [Pseudomonas sp. NFACC44-2]SDA89876.1 hypothetical protein SAMN03159429_05688 [Pseudomonas sp. NFACC51]SDB35626.1 hypothetical protein SAMN03159290_02595 [Pseudomonas sp. NFACC13-1]SDW42049.1 hypothetical protein SAMN03159474_00818 [Pseudomonas sp. NFACC08-1]SFI17257.1 hypothetical protein SAMN03159302_03593 [Pseudomonas sp. NFACC54]
MIVIKFGDSAKPWSEHGALVMTPGVDALMKTKRLDPFHYFGRHILGDWGDICDEDRQLNEDALQSGYRLMSAYDVEPGLRLWVITEADRTVTTILLPEEY